MSAIVTRADLKAQYMEDKPFVPLDHNLANGEYELTPALKLLSLIYFDMASSTKDISIHAA